MAQQTEWPELSTETKPGARWWWMGSAVDKKNLTYNLEEYSKAGMGSLEITPIYGVQKNEQNEIPHLSPKWMEMLRHVESEATRLGLQIDMNTGTGWPFGGPDVSIEDAATKLLISEYQLTGGKTVSLNISVADEKQKKYARLSRLMAYSSKGKCLDITNKVQDTLLTWKAPKGEWKLIAAFCGKTLQKVKRAAPGGEGYVMNHLSAKAVKNYLGKFERAFQSSGASYPHNFFNDSYEVYGADWSEDFFDQFAQRRGYKLEEHLPDFLAKERTDITARLVSDYRETMGELLLENFTQQWTEWANSHGTKTRNQAHGSPGNLIDLYATVDVPECEGFGLSDFAIRGLRKDSIVKQNDSDLSMLKYASSGAHIAGKTYTSSETFTWLTDHFRTSLSQCKPDMDLMFLSGVNHAYFHGTTYSPADAEWPGWKFYASIDMSPTNSIWKDAPAFFSYISRCQSFLQMGKPDNDFLLYLPLYDIWQEQDGRLLLFDIHKMDRRAPKFIEAVHRIYNAGYDVDYISDNFIRSLSCRDGQLVTSGGVEYKALVLPGVRLMPNDVLAKLFALADEGATIVFLEQYPEDVPGYGDLDNRRSQFKKIMNDNLKAEDSRKGRIIFGTDYAQTLAQTGVRPETMKADLGLSCIRRSNPDGHHYFISALKAEDTDQWVPLSVPAKSVVLYNPMTGEKGKAQTRRRGDKTEVYLQLASGESVIVKAFASADVSVADWKYWGNPSETRELSDWQFLFTDTQPETQPSTAINLNKLTSWTEFDLPGSKTLMGSGIYSTVIQLEKEISQDVEWMLDLGDVRESARLYINGEEIATLWAVPFRYPIARHLKPGKNIIEVEVTNLPANRIAEMDRKQVPWRKFKDINIVRLNYLKGGYENWLPVESGLLGPVKIDVVREKSMPKK
nr:glycosyl hydrolase [Bacteroides sp. 224]